VLGQNTAIMDYFVDAPTHGQGHSAQVQMEVIHLRNLILTMRSRGTVVCETGFNAGHSAAIWLEQPSQARLLSFDLGAEPYSESARAFVRTMYPGRLTYFKGDTTKTLPRFASRVESGDEPPCDLWYIDGGHQGKVPASDINSAWRASHDGTIMVADDCTGRFQAVRDAWRGALKRGLIMPLNGSRMPADGGSGRMVVDKPSPGQPTAFWPRSAYEGVLAFMPQRYLIGMKGWCSGVVVKKAAGRTRKSGRR